MNVEEHLRAALAARVAAVPETTDLADQAITQAGRIRGRRRMAAITASVVAVVAAVFAVVQLVRPPAVSLPADPPPISVAPAPSSAGLKVDLIHGLVLHRAGGGHVALPVKSNQRVIEAVRTAGGWLVTYQHTGSERSQTVEFVREDGISTTLGVAPDTAIVVHPVGTRAVVQYWHNAGQVSTAVVVDLPSGNVVSQAPLPGGDNSMVVRAWSGDAVVLARMSGDFGPVPVDLWNPTRGAYVASPPQGEFALLGRFGTAGHLIAMVADTDPLKACLVELDPPDKFAVLRKECGLTWERPLVSTDGQHLVRPNGSRWIAVGALFSGSPQIKELGLAEPLDAPDFHWESAEAVLVNGHRGRGLLRCEVSGRPCETVVLPGVDTEASIVVRNP
ncbi:hypothetical protein SAMN05192558_107181 [Actinokineospora alba]|uniref:Uncharacterized protein n=1 Tax=Actinokineospora alba TaxID=504798 RepID=A0A1H0QWJ8_9PSEU|nr:hypothetical protein [Actinokineospora alba]TDP70360.1 hypothetical protein C8E96_5970 [Actinokineospora alba]SDI33326.1 hypothetical protein SAMN05421871_104180 [Actinokineospora alba]SDP21681.1 hypothetical protein SAMN05192558_107181 [Actinokineospora alba]